MSLDSDVIVDRRRIRRKLTFWRVAAGLVAIAAIIAVGAIATTNGPTALAASGSIARVNIEGLSRSHPQRAEARRPAAGRGAGAAGEVEPRRCHHPHQFAWRHHGRLRAAL